MEYLLVLLVTSSGLNVKPIGISELEKADTVLYRRAADCQEARDFYRQTGTPAYCLIVRGPAHGKNKIVE